MWCMLKQLAVDLQSAQCNHTFGRSTADLNMHRLKARRDLPVDGRLKFNLA